MSQARRDRPAAVLWDMDGTLVDTEPCWFAAERRIVESDGNGHWPDEYAHELIGFDLLDSAAVLQQRGGVDLEATEIVDRLLNDVIEQVGTSLPWRPGARALLKELTAAQVPCVLVTMSWRSLVDAVLEQLPGVFTATITGDEVPAGRGKPDPLPYELGAAAAGVSPSDCVALEDSTTGARSAVGAGCAVIVTPNRHIKGGFPNGVHLVDTLDEVTVADLAAVQRSHHESD